MSRIDRMQVARERSDGLQPSCPPRRLATLRLTGPRQSQVDGDCVGAGFLTEVGKVGQQLVGPSELEAEAATETEVFVDMFVERIHATAPGQGRTNSRSR